MRIQQLYKTFDLDHKILSLILKITNEEPPGNFAAFSPTLCIHEASFLKAHSDNI